jgi:hypothetical protein
MSGNGFSGNGFIGDATYFDIVADQSTNAVDRKELQKVADEYRRLASRQPTAPNQSRIEFWTGRADKCRALSDIFQNDACRNQLLRLAAAYDLMAELYRVEDAEATPNILTF